MLQILGIILFVIGILTIAAPAKFGANAQNQKCIARGEEPMSEEAFAATVKKVRKKGIATTIGGFVLFMVASFIGEMARVLLG